MPAPEMNKQAQNAYDEALRRIKDCGPHGSELNLAGLGLTLLPHEIGQLAALTRLFLSDNHLATLPPEIGQMTALTRLDLPNNQFVSVPDMIGHLTSLIELRLQKNRLTSVSPCLGSLHSLELLSLGINRLASIPPELGKLRKLARLDLDHNSLASLPSELGNLASLVHLRLHSNRLQDLPAEIQRLSNLRELYLHNNPGLGLPAEVLGPEYGDVWDKKVLATPADPKSILAYYFAKQAQGERPLNEVRLVLVGRGAAGKTSLVQRLVSDTFNPAQAETPGIALSDWTMRGCAGGPVTAHVWDFAGQVVTHSMHRYFLSHRTVYVLVLTQREDSAGEDADYWLKLIQSYGTDKADGNARKSGDFRYDGGAAPPVIVALNKSDQARVKVDRNFLQERFPFIAGFVETDCQSGRGIAELRERLCALMDEPKVKAWVREGFPAQWWKVKEAIVREQQTRPHLSYDQWRKLCDDAGEKDKEKQDQLSKLLHTLGVALNYADDPRLHDNTVLRPNWVTHHCYNLIRHAAGRAGVLHRVEAAEVLKAGKDGESDPKMHDYLMRLMERFEAAYPLGEGYPPEKWLVPLGLPDDQPAGLALFGQTAPQKAARLRYTYPSIPPGLIAQFIVRTHPMMEEKMQWANGTVLTLNGARALVRAVSKTEIEITAVGDDANARRDLAGLCRDEINGLNAQISGLDVVERKGGMANGERVWINIETLEADELKSKTTTAVETRAGSAEVTTKTELDEFGTEEGRLPEEGTFAKAIRERFLPEREPQPWRGSKPKPRIFISYSHTDERHLKTLELHLKILKNNGFIHRVWHDRRIQPGDDWDKAIRDEITTADVIIFLTSTPALASDYINKKEMQIALERHVKGEARVVPIILERCAWRDTFANSPPLKKLKDPESRVPQCIPRDNHPINSFNPRSIGWHQVSEELKTLLTEVKAKLR
ncbi:MAG: TIR domain-containing protein [Verrucomicrobiaceae bacterium]|nr:TIR domain-containing protein [Verrucomicrobiaceae bacterium]